MPDIARLRDAVDGMVKVLVPDPHSICVELTRSETSSVIYVMTSVSDLGRIIGKKGRTVGALRLLVQAAAQQINATVSLEVSSKD